MDIPESDWDDIKFIEKKDLIDFKGTNRWVRKIGAYDAEDLDHRLDSDLRKNFLNSEQITLDDFINNKVEQELK